MAIKRKEMNKRVLMELAIRVMREAIHEPRGDSKESPRVGAVLYKSDGSIETGSRGELRYGDHAEFTLLERKLRSEKLDGATLFATLEPCAPGARQHPKLGCAERIVNARIKTVYVGIEDPDPKVDRKGIKFLQDHGIEVFMFDADLQEIIRKENKVFLEQALLRAEEAEEKVEAPMLSSLETSVGVDVGDLDDMALLAYKNKLELVDDIHSDLFQRRLLNQGLLVREGKVLKPTGYGRLLFAKFPRDVLPQAGLKAMIEYSDGKQAIKDFESAMVLLPGQIEKWLSEVLKQTISRTKMKRTQQSEVPFEVIREAVINALVHRDYDIKNAKIQLLVTNDLIVIKSPGMPLSSISLSQMNNFSAPTLSRNPVLHYVFSQMDLAEERGLGMETWRSLTANFGLAAPRFSIEGPYLVLTIFRHAEAVISQIPPDKLQQLSTSELEGWRKIVNRDLVSTSEYVELVGNIDRKTAQRHFKKFIKLELIISEGDGRSLKYKVLR